MKKIYLYSFLFFLSASSYAQIIGYTDLGVLFSQENYNGTARYNGMSGAFGALGGDISSIYQNPAGGAVFSKSEISGSLSLNNTSTNATYYDAISYNENSSFRAPQFGLVLVFNSPYSNSNWSKFTFGFNYSMLNDFNSDYKVKGNNTAGYARYNLHPFDESQRPYNNSKEQTFTNTIEGKSDVYTFSLASSYKDFLYIGSSLNFHEIRLTQDTFLTEDNEDEDGNTLFADYAQYLSETSTGASLGIGIILKPTRNIRLGVAYQSPVWHTEVIEESNGLDYDRENSYEGFKEQGYLDINSTDPTKPNDFYQNTTSNYPAINAYRYGINTPEKWTVSAAITLGQHGLISADYYQKNYALIRLTNSYEFANENEEINNILSNTRGLKAGGELRFNQVSLRGGAYIEESPYTAQKELQYKKGFSMGIGFKFKSAKFDIAYQYSEYENSYSIYDQTEPVNSISLANSSSRISSTLSFSF
jgi:hypothetical protein